MQFISEDLDPLKIVENLKLADQKYLSLQHLNLENMGLPR